VNTSVQNDTAVHGPRSAHGRLTRESKIDTRVDGGHFGYPCLRVSFWTPVFTGRVPDGTAGVHFTGSVPELYCHYYQYSAGSVDGSNVVSGRQCWYFTVCLHVQLLQKLRPTNHATIQSIARAVDVETDVPAPCCVPASLTSVTLLYFDQHDNVVLKNFPQMSVRSCACR